MKILFVSCYVNNSHFMYFTKKCFDTYLQNATYDYVCLNDAPAPEEENYIQICDMITGSKDCYSKIKTDCEENNFIHIKIPQHIHIKNRPNHSSMRHAENFTWFNSNIEKLLADRQLNSYDYLCYIDSDAFLVKPIDLTVELDNCDLAGPIINITSKNPPFHYIHTGLFFINLKTVSNFKELNWKDTMQVDTGSDIANFLKKNSHYKVKELGLYIGYHGKYYNTENGTSIISLDIPEINDSVYKLIDVWFEGFFLHFRGGSCFGLGSLQHRNSERLFLYNKKLEAFMKHFH